MVARAAGKRKVLCPISESGKVLLEISVRNLVSSKKKEHVGGAQFI